MELSNRDTIVAIATPSGSGGIGVVRISGPNSREILEKLWRGKKPVSAFESLKLSLGNIVDAAENCIDRVMAVFMPSPQTYTGEDVVELSCHGSELILQRLVEVAIAAGARAAGPGEFTRRAFLNGKLDLAQAEAVCDLISASSTSASIQAQLQLEGRLSDEVKALHETLFKIRCFVEATIDFPEEEVDMIEREGVAAQLEALHMKIEKLRSSFQRGRILREGVRTAIIGRPNVGKSSLLNRFAGADRAIVHETPGTTRDVVEVEVDLGGVRFLVSDTAGIRKASDAVEQIGIERSRAVFERADLILLLLDGSQPLQEEDRLLLEEMKGRNVIVCVNKVDLLQTNWGQISMKTRMENLESQENNLETCPLLFDIGDSPLNFHISALTGHGLEALFAACRTAALPDRQEASGVIVTRVRHKEALDAASCAIAKARGSCERGESAEFAAHHLRAAQEELGNIIGVDVTEDLLNKIFGEFCIGK